uniref:Uncharacterized protein n=1 Tax=Chryseobacterium endophyticum TaxID=1854762 RepID=A0AAU6WVW6_9FLAO
MDLLNTRNKENRLLQYCFETQSRMVIDNTNVTRKVVKNTLNQQNRINMKSSGIF